MKPTRLLWLAPATLLVAACASEPAAPVSGALRVLVRLTQPVNEPAAIAAAAESASGRPARYVAASGPDWHALSIACSDAADCQAALERLRADTARFSAAEVDGRKRIVAPHY